MTAMTGTGKTTRPSLSFSIYAMLGWVSVVTVAVAAVAVVTLCRRRRHGKVPVDTSVVVESEREWTRSLSAVEEMSVSSHDCAMLY